MSNMRSTLKILPLLALLTACDDTTEAIEPRGLEEVLYLTQLDAEIGLVEFAEIVLKCDGLEKSKLAVTWSLYEAPNTTENVKVMGLGFSTWAGPALENCYRDLMLELGAHP